MCGECLERADQLIARHEPDTAVANAAVRAVANSSALVASSSASAGGSVREAPSAVYSVVSQTEVVQELGGSKAAYVTKLLNTKEGPGRRQGRQGRS